MLVFLTKAFVNRALNPREFRLMVRWFLEAYGNGYRPPELVDYDKDMSSIWNKLMNANGDLS